MSRAIRYPDSPPAAESGQDRVKTGSAPRSTARTAADDDRSIPAAAVLTGDTRAEQAPAWPDCPGIDAAGLQIIAAAAAARARFLLEHPGAHPLLPLATGWDDTIAVLADLGATPALIDKVSAAYDGVDAATVQAAVDAVIARNQEAPRRGASG